MLLERDAELDVLRVLARDAGRGCGRLVTVQGPAGIGKTRLLDAACAQAARAKARVLRARGSDLESNFAFGAVRQLLDPPLGQLDPATRRALLDGPVALASGVFDDGPAAAGPLGADPSFPVLTGLLRLVEALARDARLVIAVDDAQWLDRPSLRFLDFLSRRVDGLRLLMLMTCRSGEDHGEPSLVELLNGSQGHHLRPAPLTVEATTQLVRASHTLEAGDAFCRACHDVTGGNPFLLRELLGELTRAGATVDAGDPGVLRDIGPSAVTTAILVRVRRLPPAAQALVRAVAVLGDDTDLDHAAAVAGLETTAAASAAEALAAVDILDPGLPVRFVHATVRAAVASDLSPTERAALHRTAALALAARAAPPERVAAHLLAVAGAGDQWVVETLRAAAALASARGAADGSIAYLRRALAEPPADDIRTDVLRELGLAELRVGDLAAIAHLEEALAKTHDPARRAETARALTTTLMMGGEPTRALEVIEDVVATMDTADARLARRLDAELSAQAWFLLAHTDQDHELRVPALIRLERFGVPVAASPAERVAQATLAFARCRRAPSAAAATEQAQRGLADGHLLADAGVGPSVFYGLVNALLSTDRLDLAEGHLRQAVSTADAQGSVLGWVPDVWLSHVAHRRGRLEDSERGSRDGLAQLAVFAWPVPVPVVLSFLLDALREQGRLAEAEETLNEHGATAEIPPGMLQDYLLEARGRLRIAQGRPADGVADLLEFCRRHDVWGATSPDALRHRSHAAIGLAALGETAQARRLAAEDHRRARRWGTSRAIGTTLRARANVGDARRAVGVLEQAVRVLERSPAQLELAHALVDLGAALRRRRDRAACRDPLRRGLALADGCGATALADRALTELAAAGTHPRRLALTGVAALTPSEERVAALAAAGHTNGAIARELFVTRKTVEIHLTHSYRKLEIRTRAQLPRALGRRTRDP